jgi:hypothetical protein
MIPDPKGSGLRPGDTQSFNGDVFVLLALTGFHVYLSILRLRKTAILIVYGHR